MVHVIWFLHLLLVREDVERNVTPLPDAVIAIAVDAGREAQTGQQGAAPGITLIAGQGSDNLLRRPLLEFLEEADRSVGRLGPDQQVKVIGHQDPTVRRSPISFRTWPRTSTKIAQNRW